MLHQGVDKYIGFETAYELKIGDIPRGFDYYAMGHLHLRRMDEFDGGKLAYPGSTEIWRVDELGDYEENGKGFYILDTKRFDVQKFDLKCIRPHFSDAVAKEGDMGRIQKAIANKRRPVLHLEVAAKAVDYADVYQKLVDEFRERVLYLDLKRKPLEEEKEAFEGKGVSVRELLEEAMRSGDRTDEEIGFAYELFTVLSEKKIEKAVEVAEEFYKASGGREERRHHPVVHEEKDGYETEEVSKLKESGHSTGQSSLEVFK